MKLDTRCVLCDRLDEDAGHSFFKCKRVRRVWQELNMEQIRLHLASVCSAKGVLEEILKLKNDIQCKVVTLLYAWWSERCGVREGETPRSSTQLVCFIYSYAEEFTAIRRHSDEPASSRVRVRPVWRKPPGGFMKLNCDGAFRPQGSTGGWGFVVPDDDGTVIASGYGRLENVLEPVHAEIIACLQAGAAEIGIQKIVLETDAMAVVEATFSRGVDSSSASGLLWELKDLLSCNFVFSSVVHNPRSCNLGAHSLAALGATLSLDLSPVRDSFPSCIQDMVANDLESVST